MPHLLLQSITDFLVLVLCNVHIRSHPLNDQQEQITLWFYPLNGKGLEPIVLPWKCQSGHIMELCDECNNCIHLQFCKENVFRDIPFLLMDIPSSFGENINGNCHSWVVRLANQDETHWQVYKVNFRYPRVRTVVLWFVILHHFVSTLRRPKSSNLHKSKSRITRQPRVP